MEITFELSDVDYVRMLSKVPPQSPAFVILRNARSDKRVDSSIYFTMSCDKAEAEMLLQVAKQHCPDAAVEIEEAVRRDSDNPK